MVYTVWGDSIFLLILLVIEKSNKKVGRKQNKRTYYFITIKNRVTKSYPIF